MTDAANDRLLDAALTPEVTAAILEQFPSDDPFDAPDFDPVEFLNRTFPNESSLTMLDPFVARLSQKSAQLDEQVFEAVRLQATTVTQATRDIGEAKTSIRELLQKIKDIKGKAEQSEVMVQEICRDIKQLDYAKQHLTATITALKRSPVGSRASAALPNQCLLWRGLRQRPAGSAALGRA